MPFWFRFLIRYLVCSAALLVVNTIFFVLINIIDGKPAFEDYGPNYFAAYLLLALIMGFVVAELTSRPGRQQTSNQETTHEITSES